MAKKAVGVSCCPVRANVSYREGSVVGGWAVLTCLESAHFNTGVPTFRDTLLLWGSQNVLDLSLDP